MPENSSPVESVDRALRLALRLRDSGPMSVSEAAEFLNVAPSTAHRLLGALAFRGFASQTHDRRYRLGNVLTSAEGEAYPDELLRQVSYDALVWLNQQVGETVQVMVRKGRNIQFIEGVQASHVLRVARRVGDEMPAFVSSGGKALLARMTNAEVEQVYEGGLPHWPTSRLSSVQELKRQMTKVRRDGFASSFEETEQGVVGIGVCIADAEDRPIAALTTATPSVRFDRADIPKHVSALTSAAEMILSRLTKSPGAR